MAVIQRIDITKFISDMLAPVVMISARKLFLLGLQNKYSRIINAIGESDKEKRKLKLKDVSSKFQEARFKSAGKQVSRLSRRARFNKNSISNFYSGAIFFMLTSLLPPLKTPDFLIKGEASSLLLFMEGTALVFSGKVLAYLGVRVSYREIQL